MVKRHRPVAIESLPALNWRDHALTGISLLVLLLALVRCLVPFTANLYWETDPRQAIRAINTTLTGEVVDDTVPVLFFGVTGAAVCDAMSLAVCGVALLLHVSGGGKLRHRSIFVAIVGIAFCFFHARTSIDNAFHCGSWIGGISLALAALHLGQRDRQRRWFIAILMALTVPLFIDAARFVFLDHAETIAMFKENEQSFLAARGWEADSPEHQMYLRRMSFAEPTGAFTFSNILGSIGGSLAVLSTGIAIGLWLKRKSWGLRWLLPASVALLGLCIVLLTHSKGAPVAMIMAMMLVALAWWSGNHPRWRKLVPVAAVALVFVAIVIVIARGLMGPPSTADGERSLLFRYHYWQAASRIIASDPSQAIVGSGPSRFSDEYNWAKNPLNPEEVRSAHSVFIDYTTMLGLGGIAISALLLTWLAQAAACATQNELPVMPTASPEKPSDQDKPSLQVAGTDMAWTLAFIIALFGIDYLVRGPAYGSPDRFLIWSLGMIGCFFLASVLTTRHWLNHIGVQLGLLGAAALLLIHAQIEMTYFQASSAPIAWLVVALAASKGKQHEQQSESITQRSIAPMALALPMILILFSFTYFFTLTLPIAKQQTLLADAERKVRQSPASWSAFRETLAMLEEAQRIGPFNAKPFEWQSRLAMEAAASLGSQLKGVPEDKIRKGTSEEIHRLTMMSLAAHDRAAELGYSSLTLLRQEAQLRLYAAEILSQPQYAQESLALWRKLIVLRPYAWADRIELAEILWRIGSQDEAKEHYEKAIKLSQAMHLEPTRMMPTLEMQRIEKRLE